MGGFLRWVSLLIIVAALLPESTFGEGEDGKYPKAVFVVLSQVETYHVSQAKIFKDHFLEQVTDVKEENYGIFFCQIFDTLRSNPKGERPRLLFAHEDFVTTFGAWNILNLIQPLWDSHDENNFDWVFFCEEGTRISVKPLLKFLSTFDHSESLFLGRALRDKSTTIIHHFAFANNPSQFAYPDFGTGFALSISLMKRLQSRLATGKLKTDFTIDPKHELALFIWEDGKGTSLTDNNHFCFAEESSKSDCLTTHPIKFPECGAPVENNKLFVAVKTCKQFHSTRVPVVKATWAEQAEVIEYYSEEVDKDIPTVNLGIPNTERGHCGKTMAIIRRVLKTQHHTRPWWVLIADDDTIINLDRLRALLACYNNHREPVALGERYGYGLFRGRGYDYITGGGGMVFNLPAITLLAESCRCPSDDSPDDMMLGMCLQSIGIPVTHSRFFHQARPEDYSEAFLSNQHPVSFHKHWEVDPYKVFERISTPVIGDDKAPSTGSEQKDEL